MNENVRALIVVTAVGTTIFATATTLLWFAFDAFRTAKPGDKKHIVLLAITMGFIFFCSLALMFWSLK